MFSDMVEANKEARELSLAISIDMQNQLDVSGYLEELMATY